MTQPPLPKPPAAGRPAPPALVVDWTACRARGLCADLLPELLESDPWGYPKPRPGVPRTPGRGPGALAEVPPALEQPARRAVHLCPRLALRLTD